MCKILLMIFMLFVFDIYGSIFLNGKIEEKTYTINNYYNSLNIDDIKLRINECDKRKENCNTDIIVISHKNGNKTKNIFNFDFGKLKIVSKGRYKSHIAVIIAHEVTIKDKITKLDKRINTYWLISNKSGKYTKTKTIKINSKILKEDDTPLVMENFGLINFKITKFLYQAEPNGKIASVIVDKSNHLRVSNGKNWIKINNYKLSKKNMISIYPDSNSNRVFVAIYKYINPFNKGLDLIVANFDNNSSFYTSIYNSDEKHFGFNPVIFTNNNKIFITAYNKTIKQKQMISINKNNLEHIKFKTSPYIKGFEKEKNIDFIIGSKFMQGFEHYKSFTKSITKNSITPFSWLSYVKLKIQKFQLELRYSPNNIGKENQISGILNYSINDIIFAGISYAHYSYSDILSLKDANKNKIYNDYDNLSSNEFKFVITYSSLSKIIVNEVNYNNFYITSNINFGINILKISNELKDKVNNKNIIGKFPINISADLEIGYIWQKKFRNLNGIGYYLLLGYRVNTNIIYSFNSNRNLNNNELLFENKSLYIQHGPFISLNLIW